MSFKTDEGQQATPLHLDTMILKTLALEHVRVSKQHALHLVLPLTSKPLGDRCMDWLRRVDGEPLVLFFIGSTLL